QDETRMREQFDAERELLQAQLASCLERLQNREAYRAIHECTIRELDDELADAMRHAEEQEARASQLSAELEVREQRLLGVVRERDEARRSHDTVVAQHAMEREASEQTRRTLESRVAEGQGEIASLERALGNARQGIDRGRATVSELTAALERSQTKLAEQSRLLEERESVARTMAASHAQLMELVTALRGQ